MMPHKKGAPGSDQGHPENQILLEDKEILS
nr:MAG TPA: hypothetical protein [Caudoviricetes sp.]